MKKLHTYGKEVLDRINGLPFFQHNPPKINFLILLGAFAFVVFVVDINSEMAVEKDEMGYIVGVLENSIEELTLSELSVTIFNLNEQGVLKTYNVPIQTNDVLSLPRDRSPPAL